MKIDTQHGCESFFLWLGQSSKVQSMSENKWQIRFCRLQLIDVAPVWLNSESIPTAYNNLCKSNMNKPFVYTFHNPSWNCCIIPNFILKYVDAGGKCRWQISINNGTFASFPPNMLRVRILNLLNEMPVKKTDWLLPNSRKKTRTQYRFNDSRITSTGRKRNQNMKLTQLQNFSGEKWKAFTMNVHCTSRIQADKVNINTYSSFYSLSTLCHIHNFNHFKCKAADLNAHSKCLLLKAFTNGFRISFDNFRVCVMFMLANQFTTCNQKFLLILHFKLYFDAFKCEREFVVSHIHHRYQFER